jgi:hypothetical protein
MIAHDYPIEESNGRVATSAEARGWHLWTVIIPRRSISGKLVSGQVWRRRHGAKWAYKKFVEYADRDITGSGRGTKRTSHGTRTMKPTDYDMIKLALNSIDLVILRSLVQQAMKRRPDADWQRLDLLSRARDLLAEFYQGNGHARESLANHERGPPLN